MLNIIYGAGSTTIAGRGIYLSDAMVSVFLLFFGLLFFFALDIIHRYPPPLAVSARKGLPFTVK